MSLRSVDLPAPLGPTSAIRRSKSIPKSMFLYMRGPESLYLKLTFCTIMTGGGMVPGSGNVNEITCRMESNHVKVNHHDMQADNN